MSTSYLKASLIAAPVLIPVLWASDARIAPDALVVHEWGTFTSVADEQGAPVEWAPLSGPADLPCFVEQRPNGRELFSKLRAGLVRMETPVLYFYSQSRTKLSVHVGFPEGWITEWYPRATDVAPHQTNGEYRGGLIRWDSIEVAPGENPELPRSKSSSHYYAARNTDAAALHVEGQAEKLLFYRGIGSFRPPLQPTFTPDGKLTIVNAGAEAIPLVVAFDNREGRVAYRVARDVKDSVTLDAPQTGSVTELQAELAARLEEFGLYRKEALAMIETWKDSWFEQGTRVFFVYPRSAVDAILPLTITPAPTATARVFVGRVELLSPWMEQNISGSVARSETAGLKKFGRFLDPFIQQTERIEGRKLFSSPDLQRTRSEISRLAAARSCVE